MQKKHYLGKNKLGKNEDSHLRKVPRTLRGHYYVRMLVRGRLSVVNKAIDYEWMRDDFKEMYIQYRGMLEEALVSNNREVMLQAMRGRELMLNEVRAKGL